MFEIKCLYSKVENSTSIFSRFCITLLKKHQSITVGIDLRCILLSAILGLRKDLLEIFLDLKQVVFKGNF